MFCCHRVRSLVYTETLGIGEGTGLALRFLEARLGL